MRGAITRAKNALATLNDTNRSQFQFAIGMEGGLERINGKLFCMAWMCCIRINQDQNKNQNFNDCDLSVSKTSAFQLPSVLGNSLTYYDELTLSLRTNVYDSLTILTHYTHSLTMSLLTHLLLLSYARSVASLPLSLVAPSLTLPLPLPLPLPMLSIC